MSDPIKYLMDHKQIVLDAYNQDSSPVKSWKHLCGELPDIESEMKFNTFKQYFRSFVLIIKEYEERQNHIAGWSVTLGGDGYYRGKRRMYNKLQSVYLGKEFDREAFTVKIQRKEKDLLIV
jgi:hypothetical protein